MINPWLLLSGIGMMLIGVVPALWWWRTKAVSVKFFGYGAALWIIAVTPKIFMDSFITPSLRAYLAGYGSAVLVIITGIYVGLQTGFFENGFTYIAALKTKLKHIDFKQAVAFGLGFGGFEAFILGLMSFLNILVFLAMPNILEQLPIEQKEAVLQQVGQSTWIIFSPLIERGFTLFIHLFSMLLVFYVVKFLYKRYLIASISYKSVVDGIIPALTIYVGSQTLIGLYSMEIPIIVLGVIGIIGFYWIKEKWYKTLEERNDSES